MIHAQVRGTEMIIRAALEKLSEEEVQAIGKAVHCDEAWHPAMRKGTLVTYILLRWSALMRQEDGLKEMRQFYRELLS